MSGLFRPKLLREKFVKRNISEDDRDAETPTSSTETVVTRLIHRTISVKLRHGFRLVTPAPLQQSGQYRVAESERP